MTKHVFSVDAYAPAEMAQHVATAGVSKANLNPATMFALAVLAGAFIALGGNVSTIALTNNGLGYGVSRLLGGVVFSLGLILVIVGGAELFTGNNLIVMAWASGKLCPRRVCSRTGRSSTSATSWAGSALPSASICHDSGPSMPTTSARRRSPSPTLKSSTISSLRSPSGRFAMLWCASPCGCVSAPARRRIRLWPSCRRSQPLSRPGLSTRSPICTLSRWAYCCGANRTWWRWRGEVSSHWPT